MKSSFSDVFRGYRKRVVARNGLTIVYLIKLNDRINKTRLLEAATGDLLSEKVLLEISQNLWKSTSARVSFLPRLQ